MLRTLIGNDERYQETLVQVLNQGIQFDGWVCLTSDGISLDGYRVVAVMVETVDALQLARAAGQKSRHYRRSPRET